MKTDGTIDDNVEPMGDFPWQPPKVSESELNDLLSADAYRYKFLLVCRQLVEEHKYILRLETIIGNQRKELKRLNNLGR